MKRDIIISDHHIQYTVRHNTRSRTVRLVIHPELGLIVTVPNAWHERFIERFIRQKYDWIQKHLERARKYADGKSVIRVTDEEYKKNKTNALRYITERVEFFNSLYSFAYRKISIRNQTTLWGSCTRTGNIQFNYKLLHIPQQLSDYVVVHELCHLKEHNHKSQFWNLVAKVIPDHKNIRKSLTRYIMKVDSDSSVS